MSDDGTPELLAEPLPWQHHALARGWSDPAAPAALLLWGPAGHGQGIFARHLARARVCEQRGADGSPCGKCPGCHLAGLQQHPDVRVYEPMVAEKDGEVRRAEWITVDQIRDLIGFVQLSAHRGRAKVGIVDPADRLNAEAANALLKTLEEPPSSVSLILVTARPGRLPATVRSRCALVAAPSADLETARQWLAAEGQGDAGLLLAQGGGAPLLARALADPGIQAARGQLLRSLARPETADMIATAAVVDDAPRPERRERLATLLRFAASWCADLARTQRRQSVRFCPDFAADLARLGQSVVPVDLFRYYREIGRMTGLVAHPLQARLVMERLLLDYQGIFAASRPR